MSRRAWLSGIWASLAIPALTGIVPVAAGEPYPYTEEWWAMRAMDPPGSRQVEKDGKQWPPYPRPTGEKQHWVHKYHHAHYWPHPYNCEDQAFVRNIIDQQAAAGWVSATTLRDYHFDPDTHELNSVGRDHLHWIVTSTPVPYRMVYVAQSFSKDQDVLRQTNTEKMIAEFQPGSKVPVLLKYDRFLGRPAQEIDQLRRLELMSIPRPRLFTVGTATGNGGSGSNAAQAGGMSGLPGGSGSGNTR